MSGIQKVREHSSTEDKIIHHETEADIVLLDDSTFSNVKGKNVQDALKTVDSDLTGIAHETTLTAKITASNFKTVGSHYEAKINVTGIKETDNPVIGLLLSSDESKAIEEMESWGCINRITCGNGFLNAICYEDTPDADFNIQIKIVR